ncbi:MAG TPA: hypothetical protein VIK79_06570 [Xanthobacteraceae bacterium]
MRYLEQRLAILLGCQLELIEWAMQDAAKFREYAEQCKKLAQSAATEKDRKALLEIAQAWLNCASEAERKSNKGTKND